MTIVLMVLLTAGLVGGTLWLMLSLQLVAWLEALLGFGGLTLSTLVNLGLFWFLWSRSTSLESEDSDEDE
ncbi:hypothetical protein [Levilactobacillus yonginensis]|uniref:hypothetical protein n=1 Tax=Levilactobacillus yonginensis TaxID=1054041 RepID=UPI00345D0143